MSVAKAFGYIIVETLGVQKDKVFCGSNKQYANFILGEIFKGGNFGMKKVVYRRE